VVGLLNEITETNSMLKVRFRVIAKEKELRSYLVKGVIIGFHRVHCFSKLSFSYPRIKINQLT
jgi:hypothetical protein